MSIRDEVIKKRLNIENMEIDTLVQLFSELSVVGRNDKMLTKEVLKTLYKRKKLYLVTGGKNGSC